jgi:hypothetical protein
MTASRSDSLLCTLTTPQIAAEPRPLGGAAMEVWARLKVEPAKLRAAVCAHDRRRVSAVIRRLSLAMTTLSAEAQQVVRGNGHPSQHYQRLAELAAEYGVHPKTLQRWLDHDAPDALLKRKRLVLVHMPRYHEWQRRFGRVRRPPST